MIRKTSATNLRDHQCDQSSEIGTFGKESDKNLKPSVIQSYYIDFFYHPSVRTEVTPKEVKRRKNQRYLEHFDFTTTMLNPYHSFTLSLFSYIQCFETRTRSAVELVNPITQYVIRFFLQQDTQTHIDSANQTGSFASMWIICNPVWGLK